MKERKYEEISDFHTQNGKTLTFLKSKLHHNPSTKKTIPAQSHAIMKKKTFAIMLTSAQCLAKLISLFSVKPFQKLHSKPLLHTSL